MNRLLRIVGVLGLALGGLVATSAPAEAVSGPWLQVAASDHTCAINTGHSLYCWGENGNGQTGNGVAGGTQLPLRRVGAAGAWSSVAAGTSHTCGITTAKNLYCWGNNGNGQIGNGVAGGNQLPLYRVGGVGVWTRVAAGNTHSCGITTAMNLYCWGNNTFGQVGYGAPAGNQLPLFRVGGTGIWNNIVAGSFHTCGITTAKNLYCWGSNTYAQIGDGDDNENQRPLARIGGVGVWSSIAAGAQHTCGITTAKNLYCWGYNAYGQTGTGSSGPDQTVLLRVGAAGVWSSVTGGGNHTCGITTAKNLYCWGYNAAGQTGTGATSEKQLSLHRVGAAGVWNGVAGGVNHTAGITTAKNLYTWGYNFSGQIGTGSSGGNQLTLFRVQ